VVSRILMQCVEKTLSGKYALPII